LAQQLSDRPTCPTRHQGKPATAHAKWSLDEVGVRLARLIAARLAGEGERVRVVIDNPLFHRVGKKVFAAWRHDGSAKGPNKIGRGTCFVVAAIVVDLPFCSRTVALPVLFRLWRPAAKDTKDTKGGKGGNAKSSRAGGKRGGSTKDGKAKRAAQAAGPASTARAGLARITRARQRWPASCPTGASASPRTPPTAASPWTGCRPTSASSPGCWPTPT
jgi:hypothetical protein